ncbi:TetR/AcrR family transcriptional regulator [Francisella sp. 19X1-34]|uniref:TetR/AcrR family transcriptional regulator n=1 Tax=Francisella sp. 19X1-34 TaxID=3087177 RepID=UPI002E2EB98C|nr:TetR/AcrR family transcriptional regulator [Francisella sp. 19X1-34]MED7788778.1 TetR/AcrR family transcriptional regulator [Francisella sp. 19X1-34]
MNIQQAKSEKTKQTIVEAVYQIVREEGVHAVSSTKIIKTAGISKGRFFHHFHQVEDLYLYVLDRYIEKTEVVSPKKFKNFREFVSGYIKYNFDILEKTPEEIVIIFYFYGYSQSNSKYKDKFKDMLKSSFHRWMSQISVHFETNISEEQKDRLLRLLDMYICGLGFHYLVWKDKKLYHKVNNDLVDMITNFFDQE